MAYAIGNICFGIDFTEGAPARPVVEQYCGDGAPGWEEALEGSPVVQTFYSGSGESPLVLGLFLEAFDECANFPLADLAPYLTVTDEMRREWECGVRALCGSPGRL